MALSWSIADRVPSDSRVELDPSGSLRPGQAFGPYDILGALGAGSSARVYEARGPQGERLALKVLREEVSSAQRERFQREGALLARLHHPGIVRVQDGGEVGGHSFLAYELVEGGRDLRQALSGAPLTLRVQTLLEVTRAVAHAHAGGVVHRDLKPANILVDAAGQVRVADFGLALAQGLERLTRSGAAVGTPLYMAPEQAAGDRAAVGAASDVWSIGVLLYEALTGARPFPAVGWLELRALLEQGPPPPRTLNPALTPDLERVILRCLALDPAARFPDAGALADALAAAFHAATLSGSPTPPPLPGGVQPTATARSAPFALGPHGRFELQAILGQGGMGVVYRARDTEAERDVAVKCITGELTGKRLTRFLREGELTASLNHPNVLRVHSAGVLDDIPYLVYELIEGARTLDQVTPALDRRERLALLRDTARGLGYAHRQGVFHRDVKPENVLVDEGGRPLVADFGLAAAEGLEKLTKTGALVGTPHYISPEVLRGERDKVGPPADVWALGVILFELLCDQLPFQGATLVELAGAITTAEIPSVRALDPEVDRRLEAIVRRALARDPEQRYPDAEELADDLDAWLEGRRLSASTTHAGGFPALLARRSRWFLALGAAVPIVIACAFLALRTPPSPTEAAATPSPTPPVATPPTPTPTPSATGPDPNEPLFVLQHGTGRLRVAFLPDGSLLSASIDGTLARWSKTGQQLSKRRVFSKLFRGKAPIADIVALSPDEVLITSLAGVFCFRGDAQDQLSTIKTEDLALNRRLGRLVGASEAGILRWERQPDGTWKPRATIRTNPRTEYRCAVISPDGEQVAAFTDISEKKGIGEYRVELWSWAGTRLARNGLPGAVRVAAYSPDGKRIVVGSNTGQVFEIDPVRARPGAAFVGRGHLGGETALRRAPAHEGTLSGLVFARGGSRLVTTSRGDLERNNEIRLWDTQTRRESRPVRRRKLAFDCLAVSSDGNRVAAGARNGFAEVWAID